MCRDYPFFVRWQWQYATKNEDNDEEEFPVRELVPNCKGEMTTINAREDCPKDWYRWNFENLPDRYQSWMHPNQHMMFRCTGFELNFVLKLVFRFKLKSIFGHPFRLERRRLDGKPTHLTWFAEDFKWVVTLPKNPQGTKVNCVKYPLLVEVDN